MDAKICDRCGKVCTENDATLLRFGNYFDLCEDCKLWLLHELHEKEEWEEKK